MQETASFVSGPVGHRPRHSSSAPPNKSFISILKLIHNLKQEERDFNTKPLNKKHMRLIFFNCAVQSRRGNSSVFTSRYSECVFTWLSSALLWVTLSIFQQTKKKKRKFVLVIKFIIRKEERRNCSTEGSLGLPQFSSTSKQWALC